MSLSVYRNISETDTHYVKNPNFKTQWANLNVCYNKTRIIVPLSGEINTIKCLAEFDRSM